MKLAANLVLSFSLISLALLFAGCLGGGNNVNPTVLPTVESGFATTVTPQAQATATPAAVSNGHFVWVAYIGGLTKLYENGTQAGDFKIGVGNRAIAVDAQGNVWVTDDEVDTNAVHKFDSNGNLLGTFKVGMTPQGIAIDPSGNVWVANVDDDTITKLDSSGNVIGTYPSFVKMPFGVASDPHGNIWVTGDYYNDGGVAEFDSNGRLIANYSWTGSKGGIAVDGDGNLWVAGGRKLVKLAGGNPVACNVSDALGIAIDGAGNIWATDNAGNTVAEYSPACEVLGEFKTGESPLGVSVDFSGNVWVSNLESSSVTKINAETGALIGEYPVGGQAMNIGDATGFALHHFVLKDG